MSTKISKVVRAGYARKAKKPIQKTEVVQEGENLSTCNSVKNVDKDNVKSEESDKKLLKRESNVDFEYHIKQIEIMREKGNAPVDSVGCHALADKTADPKTYRFQVVLSLLLSSQTKDEITAGAMGRLKNYGCTVDKMIRTDNNTIENLLKPVSFYKRKAANIIRIAAILKDQYDDDIPRTFDDLCKLPGIGPKMANLIMLVAWKECVGIAVDTHIHRIANRLHWVKTTDPIKTEKEIEDLLPRHHWTTINKLFVGFGQTICKAVSPLCDSCLLNDGLEVQSKSIETLERETKTEDLGLIELVMSTFYHVYERRAASHNYGSDPLGGFSFPLNVPLSRACKLLTQRNISISQKLPQLEPFVIGLSTPLINNIRSEVEKSLETKKAFIKNSFHTTSTDFGAYERRNVICGTNKFDSSDIYLYSVNELGEQKSLYEYILEYNEADCEIEIPECCLKKRYKVTTKSVNKKHESEHPIVETLMHYNENHEDKIWLRTKKTLDLLNCENEEVHTVYENYVKTFKQIPYMDSEICFIDSLDFAWYGDIETNNYSRIKFKDPLTDIATTDCPKVFYAFNDDCVFEFDYRELTTAQYKPVIQQKNLMSNWPQTLYNEINTITQPLFKFKYLISPMEQTNTLIVVTNRFYIVFDNRYINRPILRLPHCIYDGGDYVIFTEKGLDFKSSGNGNNGKLMGKLYLSYQLSKDVEPGVSYNCFFYNKKEDVFSSTVLASYLPDFEDIASYFENKRPEDLMDYGDKIDDLTEGVYARSVCHVSLNNNSEEFFVFRSNSDGSIWYDEIAINAHNLGDDEINVTSINKCQHFWNSQSCLLIKGYVDDKDYEKTRGNKFIWDECLPYNEVDDLIKHTPVDFSSHNENEVNEIVVGLSKKIKEKVDLSDVVSLVKEISEEHELSNIVLEKMKFVDEIIESVAT